MSEIDDECPKQCVCDFDNWRPEESTGHSCVCPIHKWMIRKGKGEK